MRKTLTYLEVKLTIESKNKTLISDEYKNARTKLIVKCEHNHIYETTLDNFKRIDGRCPVCKGFKLTIEDVANYINEVTNGTYSLVSKEYKNNRERLDIMCSEGHVYKQALSVFKSGHRCKVCSEIEKIKRQTNTYEYVKNYIEVESNSGYKLLSESYMDNETPLTLMCDKGHIYEVSFGNFINNKRCKKCFHIRNTGEGNPRWNPNITDEERQNKRHIFGYSEWRFSVYERDNYTCQCCGNNQSGNLVAHHLDGYNWCKEKRTDVDNGVTLCEKCHVDFHLTYGYGDNTKEQFDIWINNKIKLTS